MPYAHRELHRERTNFLAKERRKKNPEYFREYSRKQHKKHKEKEKLSRKKYEEKIKSIPRICAKCPNLFTGTKIRKYCPECLGQIYNGNQFHKFVKNYQRGDKHHNWKGGRSGLRKTIRDSSKYRHWRTSIFERDLYCCVLCGAKNGRGNYIRLEGDHFPIPFAEILDKNKISSWNEAETCPKLWDISNGRTLCIECHNKTKNGNQSRTKDKKRYKK